MLFFFFSAIICELDDIIEVTPDDLAPRAATCDVIVCISCFTHSFMLSHMLHSADICRCSYFSMHRGTACATGRDMNIKQVQITLPQQPYYKILCLGNYYSQNKIKRKGRKTWAYCRLLCVIFFDNRTSGDALSIV